MKATKKILAVLLTVCMMVSVCAMATSVAAVSASALQQGINDAIAQGKTSYKWSGAYNVSGSLVLDARTVPEFTLNLGGSRINGDEGVAALTIMGNNVTVMNGSLTSNFGVVEFTEAGIDDAMWNNVAAININKGNVRFEGIMAAGSLARPSFINLPVSIPIGAGVRVVGDASLTVSNSLLGGNYGIRNNAGSTVVIEDAVVVGFGADYTNPDTIVIADGYEKVDLVSKVDGAFTGNHKLGSTAKKLLGYLFDGSPTPMYDIELTTNSRVSAYIKEAQMDVSFDYDFDNDQVIVKALTDDSGMPAEVYQRYQYYWEPQYATLGGVTKAMTDEDADGIFTANFDAANEAGEATVRYRLYLKLGTTTENQLIGLTDTISEYYAKAQDEVGTWYVRNFHNNYVEYYPTVISTVAELYNLFKTYDIDIFDDSLRMPEILQAVIAIGGKSMLLDNENGGHETAASLSEVYSRYGFSLDGDTLYVDKNANGALDAGEEVTFIADYLVSLKNLFNTCVGDDTWDWSGKLSSAYYHNNFDFAALADILLDEYDNIVNIVLDAWEYFNTVVEIINSDAWADAQSTLAELGIDVSEYITLINDYYDTVETYLGKFVELAGRSEYTKAADAIERHRSDFDQAIASAVRVAEHPENYIGLEVNAEKDSLKLYSVTDVFTYEKFGEVEVSVDVSGSGSVVVLDNPPVNSNVSEYVEDGTEVTIQAIPDDGYDFMYWVNSETNKILSLNEEYTYPAFNYAAVQAVFNVTDDTYETYTGGVLKSGSGENPVQGLGQIYAEGVGLPSFLTDMLADEVVVYGYNFLNWSTPDLSSYDSLAALHVAQYEEIANPVSFFVDGGEAFVDNNGDGIAETKLVADGGNYMVTKGTIVTIVADSGYWVDGDETQINAEEVYSFVAKKDGMSYFAVAGDGGYGGIRLIGTDYDDATGRLYVYAERGIASEYAIAETGLILTRDDTIAADANAFVVGKTLNPAILRAKASSTANNGIYGPYIGGYETADTYFVRAYVTLTNGTTIYSDIYYTNNYLLVK